MEVLRSDRLAVSQRTCTETGHTPQPLRQLAVSSCRDVAAALPVPQTTAQTLWAPPFAHSKYATE